MTVRQLLTNLDSYELTEWLAFFEVKAERDEAARERADFEHRLNQP